MVDGGEKFDHEFGAEHTQIKLDTLAQYLQAYTTALKNTRFKTHYIDAFAGTGSVVVKIAGERVEVAGSASIAVACSPAFDRMVFIEMEAKKVRALEHLVKTAQSEVEIIQADTNVALPQCIAKLGANDRAVAFLDPFGMQLAWQTLEAIASSGVVDVWYFFSLLGLYRQTTLDAADLDTHKANALTRVLGTDEWRKAFYGPKKQLSLLGDDTDERKATVPEMVEWIKKRLEVIFPDVAQPKILRMVTPSGKPGAPLFALFFLVSNPAPKARAIAMRIAAHILRD